MIRIDKIIEIAPYYVDCLFKTGELKWEKIILSPKEDSGKRWDYDISPEYAYEIGTVLV